MCPFRLQCPATSPNRYAVRIHPTTKRLVGFDQSTNSSSTASKTIDQVHHARKPERHQDRSRQQQPKDWMNALIVDGLCIDVPTCNGAKKQDPQPAHDASQCVKRNELSGGSPQQFFRQRALEQNRINLRLIRARVRIRCRRSFFHRIVQLRWEVPMNTLRIEFCQLALNRTRNINIVSISECLVWRQPADRRKPRSRLLGQ